MKKLIFLLLGSMLMGSHVLAEEIPTDNKNTDEIYVRVEKKAEFAGGIPGLQKYLVENIQYPDSAKNQGIQGIVYTRFVVNKDGSISDVEVARSAGEILDAEAIRVVKAMPNWTPAENQGKKVNSKFTLPISFKMAK